MKLLYSYFCLFVIQPRVHTLGSSALLKHIRETVLAPHVCNVMVRPKRVYQHLQQDEYRKNMETIDKQLEANHCQPPSVRPSKEIF